MPSINEKKNIKRRCFNFLKIFWKDIRTKFDNICWKTWQYNIPDELYQKRTSRKNRSLISRRTVKANNLTINQLNSFEWWVVVEFANFDYFSTDDGNNEVFNELKKRIWADENVSSIITFRGEGWTSSSSIPREALQRFLTWTNVIYKWQNLTIDRVNYEDYFLQQNERWWMGNEKRSGFLFISIRWWQQNTIESHRNQELTLFNPACEYAGENTCLDIDLVLSFFALHSICTDTLLNTQRQTYDILINDLQNLLRNVNYRINGNDICLLNYCINHPSIAICTWELIDPIQIERISIKNFEIKDKTPESVDLTHNEAVNKEKFYWDDLNNCILSPARPTNIFWSFHLSNMMQQDFDLKDYLDHQERVHALRRRHLNLYGWLRGI